MTWDDALTLFDGPGQARRDDPLTSKEAARLIRAKATSARVVLLEAHYRSPVPLIDEDAAIRAGLSLASEYATRCSELERAGFLENTGSTQTGRAGAQRMLRQITPAGRGIIYIRWGGA